MTKIFLTLALIIFSIPAFAQDFCSRNQRDISAILTNPAARIAFKNDGGLFNGGVCWWHSRLQRSATYLARFDARKPKPNAEGVKAILQALRNMSQVVVIPGYADFYAFTKENQQATQKMLNDWQKYDGFFNAEWRRGISGKPSLPAPELEKQMLKVFEYFKNSPVPVWIMAQLKGITSHSFLIVDMVQQGNGFDLSIIDSNIPNKTRTIQYRYGSTALRVVGSTYDFVPYVGFQNDFRLISDAIKGTCRNLRAKGMGEFTHVQDGEIELPR